MADLTEFIQGLTDTAKNKIIELITAELENTEKKAALDETVTEWAENMLEKLSLNVLVKWFIKKYIIGNISTITQMIYDLLKCKVSGLSTESEG